MERREDERRRGDKERERPKETDTNTVEKREGESTMQPCKKIGGGADNLIRGANILKKGLVSHC